MSITDELLANNATYAESFQGPLPLPPAKGVAVVACMDARLDVYRILGLNEGEAHVIRNAGGVVTEDEIRSLAISQRLLGTTEIILIPAPQGTGLATGAVPRQVLSLAGVVDVWAFARGQTKTTINFAKATLDALSATSRMRVRDDVKGRLGIREGALIG